MVVCLERVANYLHMVQLMPLPPRHLCFRKIHYVLFFLYKVQPSLSFVRIWSNLLPSYMWTSFTVGSLCDVALRFYWPRDPRHVLHCAVER